MTQIMDRAHRVARQQYVTAVQVRARAAARAELAKAGIVGIERATWYALGHIEEAVYVAARYEYDPTQPEALALWEDYQACDDRALAVLLARTWNVPARTVLKAGGLDADPHAHEWVVDETDLHPTVEMWPTETKQL
jgi:hypothetical protein